MVIKAIASIIVVIIYYFDVFYRWKDREEDRAAKRKRKILDTLGLVVIIVYLWT